MKPQYAAVLLLLAGTLVWVKTTRGPKPVADSTSSIPSMPVETGPSPLAGSETQNTELALGATPIPPPPGPVLSKPKHAALAAVEEPPAGPEAGDPGSGLTPVTAIENMRTVFRQYGSRFGGNPVGDNPEITAILNGRNPRQVVFLNPDDGARINARGELVDNWDTPYFFHQLSRTEMEIHSAGPDRRMWTSDDLVIR